MKHLILLAATLSIAPLGLAQSHDVSSANVNSLRGVINAFGFEAPAGTAHQNMAPIETGALAIRDRWFANPRLLQPIDQSRMTTIECEIKRSGELEKVTVIQSAGDDTLDSAAVSAVKESSGFKGLSGDFKGGKVRMFFSYNLPPTNDRPACNLSEFRPYKKPGRGVTAPRSISAPDPEYSEQARRAKYQGSGQLGLTVTAEGAPTDLCVERGMGMGLDEQAVAAVKTWKFKPGTENGQPVPVRISVEVAFRLY